jgi:hypothetical protein
MPVSGWLASIVPGTKPYKTKPKAKPSIRSDDDYLYGSEQDDQRGICSHCGRQKVPSVKNLVRTSLGAKKCNACGQS